MPRRRAARTRPTPLSPADVLQEMRDNPRRGMDPVLVKAFINLVGHLPGGHAGGARYVRAGDRARRESDRRMRSRVRSCASISDEQGNLLFPGTLVDLNEAHPSNPRHDAPGEVAAEAVGAEQGGPGVRGGFSVTSRF